MNELINTREVIEEIQTSVVSGKINNRKYRTHSKAFLLNDIPPSKIYNYNESCI